MFYQSNAFDTVRLKSAISWRGDAHAESQGFWHDHRATIRNITRWSLSVLRLSKRPLMALLALVVDALAQLSAMLLETARDLADTEVKQQPPRMPAAGFNLVPRLKQSPN